MKKLITLLFPVLLSFAVLAGTPIKKSDLRILYVGGTADIDRRACTSNEEYQAAVKARMAAFETFLKEYFNSVTVVNAADYTQAMSDNYDVTVMDGTPKPIAPEYMDQVHQRYLKPAYLTEDFDRPMLTIGVASSDLGSRIGCKNDWYCRCLAGDAFDWKADHPIFNGPFKVKMTVIDKPTPEEARHYAFAYDREMPKTLPMWQVQTKDFQIDENFAVGLVSRPDGYEDSPEAEIISGGVSSKSLKAVAIGRHGNFFHWGFAASPAYMTEEAKPVLANAIVYIAQFDGQGIIARKYNETIATRASIKEFVYTASEEGYQEMVEMNDAANAIMQEKRESIKAKQAKGEVLNEEPDIKDSLTDQVMEDASIEFDHVGFSYSKDPHKLVLNDINLKIHSGETIGIIGGTGSAKTTLVQLIPRLYDTTLGEVRVGGHNVKEYKIDTLRNQVAMVLQKNVLFSGTIKENLKWGNEEATDEEIIEACKAAQAHDFIMSFPAQYETELGQGGVNVSGGQKQRLCIARALLKKPKIIILDDSTSAVDTATDSKIRAAFKANLKHTTTLIIAQRIASVQDADRILVLDKGNIVAIGQHDELLQTCPIYQEVYVSQQKGVIEQ